LVSIEEIKPKSNRSAAIRIAQPIAEGSIGKQKDRFDKGLFPPYKQFLSGTKIIPKRSYMPISPVLPNNRNNFVDVNNESMVISLSYASDEAIREIASQLTLGQIDYLLSVLPTRKIEVLRSALPESVRARFE